MPDDEARKSSVEATVASVELPMAFTRGRVVELAGVLYIDTGVNWVELPTGGGSGLTQQQIEGLI